MTPTRFVLVAAFAASAAACTTYTQDLSATDASAKVQGVSHDPLEFSLGAEVEGPASWQSLNDQKLRRGGRPGDAPSEGTVDAPTPTAERFRRVPLPDAGARPR